MFMSEAPDQMKPAYLFHGTDEAMIDQTRSRLRARAEAGGGVASLEVFEAPDGRGTPDADALADSISTMSLIPTRRFLLADGIQKWGKRQIKVVTEALDLGTRDDHGRADLAGQGSRRPR